MARSPRYASGLTSDEVVALNDTELVHLAYAWIDKIDDDAVTDPAVRDMLYLLLDELTERYCPDARWAEHAAILR
jgi:hypothetical protein